MAKRIRIGQSRAVAERDSDWRLPGQFVCYDCCRVRINTERGIIFLMILRGLLSLAVLVAGVMPPGQVHAHHDGDLPHGHKTDVQRHADLHVSQSHHHGQDHHRGQAASLDSGPRRHMHLVFFGIELTSPFSDEDDERDAAAIGDQIALVRLLDERGQVSEDQARLRLLEPDDLSYGSGECERSLVHRGSTPPPVTVPPLCDRARHERSGVQLI